MTVIIAIPTLFTHPTNIVIRDISTHTMDETTAAKLYSQAMNGDGPYDVECPQQILATRRVILPYLVPCVKSRAPRDLW